MRLVPLTGSENRLRLLAIATQDVRRDERASRQRELDAVELGTAQGVCAFEGTTPVGYAVYHRTVQTHHLDTIAVDRPHRHAGVDSALLEWICTELKQMRPTALNVVIDASAHTALRFYLDRGFVVAGYVRDEFLLGAIQAHLIREVR